MSSTHNNPPIITPKLGERVWLELIKPIDKLIELTVFSSNKRSKKEYQAGYYPATWTKLRSRGEELTVLLIDNTDAGVEKSTLDDLIAKGHASIA